MQNEWFDIKCTNCGDIVQGKESYLKSAHTCSKCKKKVHFINASSKLGDMASDSRNDSSQKSVSIPLGIGIVLCPYIFSWFTLRQGYSKPVKIVSFIWLGFIFLSTIGGSHYNNSSSTRNTAAPKNISSSKDETFAELGTIANCKEKLNTIWYVAEHANDVKKVTGTRGESVHVFYKNGKISTAACNGTVLQVLF